MLLFRQRAVSSVREDQKALTHYRWVSDPIIFLLSRQHQEEDTPQASGS